MKRSMGLGLITYAVIAWFAFGGIFKPVSFATSWHDRFGAPYWPALVVGSFLAGALSFLLPTRFSLLRVPAFIAIGLLGSLLSVGLYADHLRSDAINRFGADQQLQHPFRDSVRQAPEEFQFFLHAAAMKHCIPYAWSYRSMSFYRLPPDAAVNVLPVAWLKQCSIHSDRAVGDTW